MAPPRIDARTVALGLQAAGAIVVAAFAYRAVEVGARMQDSWGFWIAWQGGLYDIAWLDRYAYVYSPAFAQAIAPLSALQWEAFWTVWLLGQLAALVLLAGPFWAALLLLVPMPFVAGYENPVAATVINGNPQLIVALAIAAGLRWPAAWAVPILTKVTPGIGILWFAIRREWRRLGIAVGATAVVTLASFAVAPSLWFEWVGLLLDAAGTDALAMEPILPIPLLVRAPFAVAILVWGALTNRYWTVPVAATLALPAIQYGGFALLVAVIPFSGLPLAPRWPRPPREPDSVPDDQPGGLVAEETTAGATGARKPT